MKADNMWKLGKVLILAGVLFCLAGCKMENSEQVQVESDSVQVDSISAKGVNAGRLGTIQSEKRSSGVEESPALDTQEKTGEHASQEDSLEEDKSQEAGKFSAAGDPAMVTESASTETTEQDAAGEEAEEEIAQEEERELTEQELKKLQWSLRSSDNGFFACLYHRPEEIDWQQVFYLGAGMNIGLDEGQLEMIRENMREEIRQKRIEEQELWDLYLVSNDIYEETEEEEEAPEEEVIEVNINAGNVTTLTLRSIQNFVRNRTGIEYSEMRKPLQWKQLTRNVFYFVHEDSNRVQVKLVSATVQGNLYHLYYRLHNKRGVTEPEYVMTVEIDGNKWKYVSNLSVNQTPPETFLNIDFYSGAELARLQGAKEMIDPFKDEDNGEEHFERQEQGAPDAGRKAGSKEPEPKVYWAVVTALRDNTRVSVEKAYLDDEISEGLAAEGFFIPGRSVATVVLQEGEKLGIKVTLEDVPKVRLWAADSHYFAEYDFGSENYLKRMDQDGNPLSTYVVGHDLNGEKRGTDYEYKEELLSFLSGTWVFYDGNQGSYTATLTFDKDNSVHLSVTGLTYELICAKWNRVYADEGKAPDVLTFGAQDERTQELIDQWYPAIKKRWGDYRVKAVQKDGIQMLYLMPENSGTGCLSCLLPGAVEDADEFVFYRFIGAVQWEDGTEDKG